MASVRKTGSGTYALLWRDEGGRQRQRNFKLKKDADRVARKIDRERDLNPFGIFDLEEQPMTGDGLYADWYTNHVEANLEQNTADGYATIWRAHLQRRIGHLDVRAITPATCANIAAELKRDKVGKSSQAKALAVLSSMLRRAVVLGKLEYHPMRGAVRVPQPKRQKLITPPGPEAVWTVADRLEAAGDDDGRTLALLIGFAGLRPEEALALDWRDVGKRTLTVQAAIAKGVRKTTKTGRTRTVELLPLLERELVAYRLRRGLPDKGLVLGRGDRGRPWSDDEYRNWRRRSYTPAAAGLAGTPYSLRHGFASLLIHEGRSIVEVAAQLGHSPSMCLDTYGHVIAELAGGRRVKAGTAVERARKAATAGKSAGSTLARTEGDGGAA